MKYVPSVSRLKVRTGRMGSNSSLTVVSRPDNQDSWDLLKPASLGSSAGVRSVCVSVWTKGKSYFIFPKNVNVVQKILMISHIDRTNLGPTLKERD